MLLYHVKLSVGRGHNGESQAGTEARRCRVPSRLRVRGGTADVESEKGEVCGDGQGVADGTEERRGEQ